MAKHLLSDIALTSPVIDRAAHLRTDPAFHGLARGNDATAIVVHGGELATRGGALVHVPLTDLPYDAELTFLGVDEAGIARYLLRDARAHVDWVGLRELGLHLGAADASLAVSAVALDHWRTRTRHCPSCGGPLEVEHSGWALRCPNDGTVQFPRTDPAAIVLVLGADGRVALGRHVGWPEGRFSTFAGFVEAGESAESAAAREVFEESGLRIDPARLEYLGSQPWPFPQSLMLGYHAYTDDTVFDLDHEEIAEAEWFSREELRDRIASGEVTIPPQLSISRRLINHWLDHP